MRVLTLVLLAGVTLYGSDFTWTAAAASFSSRFNASVEGWQSVGGTDNRFIVNPAFQFARLGRASASIDLPVAAGNSYRNENWRRGATTGEYTEEFGFAFTPGVRLRLAEGRRLSPWGSIGLGPARLRQKSTVREDALFASANRWTVALAPAAGLDVNFLKLMLVRLELRNYSVRTPKSGFAAAQEFRGGWRNNFLVLFGTGVRF